MKLAVATSTMYYLPFPETLDIISEAGFEYIELDTYSKGGDWETGQHLKDVSPVKAVRMVQERGLNIACLHDMGGVIEEGVPSAIDPVILDYIRLTGDETECVTFHPPHIKTDDDEGWWESYQDDYVRELKELSDNCFICIENIPLFEEYHVPLTEPEELAAFAIENDLYVTIDTTHFPQNGTDMLLALNILGERVKSVHLSDFADGRSHLFPGEGTQPLKTFIRNLRDYDVRVLTLECSFGKDGDFSRNTLVDRLKEAKEYVGEVLGS
ncbi:MAG: sugar phosphate isomerase/epimerase [Dehalococcoidales bacterium]|nr:sugar phosphate isomerase/epimerase [Dehalococcoidales bacterium]